MQFTADQRGVLRNGSIGLFIATLVAVPAYLWLPPQWLGVPDDGDIAQRFGFAIRWDIPILLWLAACVRQVSSARFRSPADIAGSAFSAPSPAIAIKRAVLQNSTEQAVLAIGAHLALAVTLRGRELALIPVLVALFIGGRIWFALGYRRGAPGRAGGMALTAGPTFAALLLAAVLALAGR